MKKSHTFLIKAQAACTQHMLSVESFSLDINLITQQNSKELLCMFGVELNLFTSPEYIVTDLHNYAKMWMVLLH